MTQAACRIEIAGLGCESWNFCKKRNFCRQRVGAKIQCTSCYTAYHPLCARLAGLHMEILDGGDAGEDIPVSGSLLRSCSLVRERAAGGVNMLV